MRKIAISICLISVIFIGSLLGPSSEAKEPVKIGILLPLSGPMALNGIEHLRGYEVAKKLMEEKGGLLGGPIEFIKGDAVDVKAAISECERLITVEGVKVIIGTYSSSLSLAATPIAERYGVVYFETTGSADEITERGLSHVFRIGQPASLVGITQVAYGLDLLLPKLKISAQNARIAMIHENSSFGAGVMKAAVQELKKQKLNMVFIDQYDFKSSDLSSLIVKLKQANPDVLFGAQYAQDAILFNRQSKELNFNVKAFCGCGGINLTDFVNAVGKRDAEGIINIGYPSVHMTEKYGTDKFRKIYRQLYPEREPSAYGLVAFVGAKFALDMIEKVGSLDDKALIKATRETDLPMGAYADGSGIKFNAPGTSNASQNIRASVALSQWQDGELRTIWPQNLAAAGVSTRLPMPAWEQKAKMK